MKRRDFLSSTAALSAVALTTPGFIRLDKGVFRGDCETTSDVLGPFYRPDSPVRSDLVLREFDAPIARVAGFVRHDDCTTPYQGAKVEMWHCDPGGVYDNETDQFKYRGTTYCDENGAYEFRTHLAIPYADDSGVYRPAHYHFLISAPGYQSLITQIYLVGDPYLDKDPASAEASIRTLPIEEKNGEKEIRFDVVMARQLPISASGLEKIAGLYKGIGHDTQFEFFAKDGQLWGNYDKMDPYGEIYDYKGNNHFEYRGWPKSGYNTLDFEFQADGSVKLTERLYWDKSFQSEKEYLKE